MVLTITIPEEYSSGTYETELIVFEGAAAVIVTVLRIVATWGITTGNDVSSGESTFVYSPERENSDEFHDTESSESVDTVVYGYDSASGLSRLALPPGTYIAWVKGAVSVAITIQYLLGKRQHQVFSIYFFITSMTSSTGKLSCPFR